MQDAISFLQAWYASQCDGDWEHQYGVEIGTLDNPGWRIRIDLVGTPLERVTLEREVFESDERDWYQVWTDGGAFHGACGPLNLGDVLQRFRTVASAAP